MSRQLVLPNTKRQWSVQRKMGAPIKWTGNRKLARGLDPARVEAATTKAKTVRDAISEFNEKSDKVKSYIKEKLDKVKSYIKQR